jgi:membrane protease YdiL (CAAX protease family)
MLATSGLFAAYHPVPFAAFVSAIIFVAVYRRTGSIWAPIMVHGFGNIMASPVFMGGLYFRTAGKETGEIALWAFHLAALALVFILISIYVWMARDSTAPANEEPATEIRCA